MTKEYMCDVTICFSVNNLEADNEKEYIEKLRDSFAETHNIWLSGEEISNIREVSNE